MKRYFLHSVIMVGASLILGGAIGGAVTSYAFNQKKNKKIYAGKILCIPNPATKVVELYLQMLASTSEIMQCDSIELEVQVKEPKTKIRTTPPPYSA